jgi:hypothetical protein
MVYFSFTKVFQEVTIFNKNYGKNPSSLPPKKTIESLTTLCTKNEKYYAPPLNIRTS